VAQHTADLLNPACRVRTIWSHCSDFFVVPDHVVGVAGSQTMKRFRDEGCRTGPSESLSPKRRRESSGYLRYFLRGIEYSLCSIYSGDGVRRGCASTRTNRHDWRYSAGKKPPNRKILSSTCLRLLSVGGISWKVHARFDEDADKRPQLLSRFPSAGALRKTAK